MSGKVLTLFGEEIIPEQINAVGKSRAEKKPAVPKEASTKEETAKAKPAKEKKVREEKDIVTSEELLQNFEGEKQYYSIGEVSKIFKVNTSHIRFWTNEFKMKVRTTRKGDRLYTNAQIKELKAIYHLVKERGYTIKGAKTKLKEKRKTTIEGVDLKQSLLQLRNRLVQIKNQLK
jgi:DNA-binding transcriptional MerR regulator